MDDDSGNKRFMNKSSTRLLDPGLFWQDVDHYRDHHQWLKNARNSDNAGDECKNGCGYCKNPAKNPLKK
ncbi:hypothetical protein [Methanoregula sp.]|jgi:hypothetical protein|uniref:hypothetical protein n=1 Tax=Methanoregula sp. TaxID=2052170 RepID=UPI003C20DA2D